MIDILVPVLGRPENAGPLVASIRANTTVPHTILFLVSKGDDEQLAACRACPQTNVMQCYWEAGPGDYARKINLGFGLTENEYVFCAADDLRFHRGWDTAALKWQKWGVIGTNDLGNPAVKAGRHSTHSLVRRDYAEKPGASWDGPGTVYSELYDHQCVDNELVFVAHSRGEWAFARDSVVEHLHPLWGKATTDATYEKAMAEGRSDIALFLARKKAFS